MCDYSLTGIPNRLAVEGEELVVHRFSSGSIGLASAWWSGQQTPAVCVPPGARLILREIPERLQHDLAVGPIEEVTFVQLSATPYRFRDAIRFTNGRDIRLQELREGVRVKVLNMSLPEDSSFETVREERKEVLAE